MRRFVSQCCFRYYLLNNSLMRSQKQDLVSEPPQGIDKVTSDGISIAVSVASSLDHWWLHSNPHISRGHTFHLWCIATSPDSHSRGLGRRMTEESLKLARLNGFKHAVVECIYSPIIL